MMSGRLKGILVAVPVVAALAFGGAAIAGATGGGDGAVRGDDDRGDKPIAAGAALDSASAAALAHTGGGRVTATEVGDEEGYYEIEVRRGDGSEVDVHLDRDFNVIGDLAGGDGDGDDDDVGPNDD